MAAVGINVIGGAVSSPRPSRWPLAVHRFYVHSFFLARVALNYIFLTLTTDNSGALTQLTVTSFHPCLRVVSSIINIVMLSALFLLALYLPVPFFYLKRTPYLSPLPFYALNVTLFYFCLFSDNKPNGFEYSSPCTGTIGELASGSSLATKSQLEPNL